MNLNLIMVTMAIE